MEDAPHDEKTMRAISNLCDLSGYDEDGIRATYQSFLVAAALIKACEALEEIKERDQRYRHPNHDYVDGPYALIARAALSCSAPPEDK